LHYLAKVGISTNRLGLHLIRPGRGAVVDLDSRTYPEDFSRNSQVFLFQGWNIRALDLLKKHGGAIRDYFRPAAAYQAEIAEFMKKRREGCDLVVAVVIRHGDYRKYLGGKYFYSLETYLGWMQQITRMFCGQKINFLIFSDEEQDTELFRRAQLNFYFRSGHMIENLYSMAACDYIITPPSTYGMWASFYGKTPLCVVEDPEATITQDSFSVCGG
jgi:hypothetical protein